MCSLLMVYSEYLSLLSPAGSGALHSEGTAACIFNICQEYTAFIYSDFDASNKMEGGILWDKYPL